MLAKAKGMPLGKRKVLRLLVMAAMMSCMFAMYAFAADEIVSFDPSTVMVSSFTTMGNSIIAMITAVLPIVMSIMSAFICIRYGMKFFNRFVK